MKSLFVMVLMVGAAAAQTADVQLNQVQNQNDKRPVTKPSHPGKGPKPKTAPTSQKQQQQQQQGQAQAQNQGQNQGQSQSASADNNGNAQSVTTNQVRQAPMAYAPDAFPSAPCRVSGSAGVSSPVGGVSLGGSKLDEECDKRETARAFALLGQYSAALQILCTTKAAKTVKDCLSLPATGPKVAPETVIQVSIPPAPVPPPAPVVLPPAIVAPPLPEVKAPPKKVQRVHVITERKAKCKS